MKEKETKGRKALLAIAVAVAITTTLVGCEREPDSQVRDQEFKDALRAKRDSRFSKEQFDGHSYIVYEDFRYKSGGPAIFHDPDCLCQKGGLR